MLDDQGQLNELGISFKKGEDISDMYCIYPNGRCVVIEYKSKSLRNAVSQLQDTTNVLNRVNRKVDRVITVAKRINQYEQLLLKKELKTHYIINKKNNLPMEIKEQNRKIKIELWTPEEIDDTYKNPIQTRLGGAG